ncbi:uncharacterized protein [Haliotis asinina]|uniref:uncharacterized protein n=1 Tax=Haliotis asinina TaxID=109174 RepID=UPI003532260A
MVSLYGALVMTVTCLTLVTSQRLSRQTCDPAKSQASIQSGADAIIGGVFSMHDGGADGFGCGKITSDMQAYEAIRWALDLINKKDQKLNGENLTDTYVPGIKLGMNIRDYCGWSEGALSAAQSIYPQFSSNSQACTQTASGITLGIVGASDSDASKDVSNFAQNFNIPVLSFMATAPELSSAQMYPTFMRTIPPDGPLMDVVIEAIKKFNWKYISIVYTDNSHGRQSYEAIRPRLVTAGICLTAAISTSPSDTQNITIDAVLDRLLLTKTVGVVYFGTPSVAYALLERSNAASYANMGNLQWVFTDSISLTKQFGTNKYPRGIISIVPTSRYIVEFEDHWVRINENNPSAENPWFQEWYSEQYECSFPTFNNIQFPTPCSSKIQTERQKRESFIQDRFVEPAVHAVYTYAVALRNAQKAMCVGAEANTSCSALRRMTSKTFFENYLMKVNFTYGKEERVPSLASDQYAPYFSAAKVRYNENGDILNPAYDVWNFNDAPIGGDTPGFKFRRVGSWINGILSMNMDQVKMYDLTRDNAVSPLPPSPCPQAGCTPCLGMPSPTKYLYIDGDIILNGIFSVHNPGEGQYSCGAMDLNARSGVQYTEAMVYALREVPRRFKAVNPQFLRDVSLGGLGIDDCKSGTLSRNFISDVQRGTVVVKDSAGNTLDPRNVDAYVAAHTSGLTIPIADLMNDLKRPVLGYSSASSVLSDRRKYPYFLRIHPGIDEEMAAIINILKKQGWYFVQTVYVEGDAFSLNGNEVFKKMAAENRICVVASHSYGSDIFTRLRTRPMVKPVLVIAHESQYRGLLENMISSNATGEFVILANSPFGRKQKLVQGLEEAADGVISLKWRVPDLTFFSTYLSSLRVDTNQQNPWFTEWYENLFDCYIGPQNPNGKATLCTDRNVPITQAPAFELTEESIFVINSVYAIANGLHTTLMEYCGVNYSGVCGNFTSSGTRGKRLLENIRAARFGLQGSNPPTDFAFIGYEGNVMIDVYNYRRNIGYMLIGEFNPETYGYTESTGALLNGGIVPTSAMSMCPGTCIECLYIFQEMKYQYIDGDIIIPAIFDVHMGGLTPFTCGKMRVRNGFQYTEAFAYALELINSGSMFNSVRLGGLLLDSCSSTSRSKALVNNIYSGQLMLQDSNMMNIRTQDFLSWMTYDSKSTIEVADILHRIGVPIVSPAATAPLLNNMERFSTFFRTVKSDMHVARAMAKLMKQLGFNYVITLNAPDFSSRESRDEFRKLAKEEGVCLLNSYEFGTDGSMDIILKSINESSTQVVVVFTEPDSYVSELLRAKQRLYPTNHIVFIANRRWTLPSDITRLQLTINQTVLNSITFNFNSPPVPAFTTYLGSKRPIMSNPNPWFREYYEERYQCNLPGTFRFNVNCGQNYGSVTQSDFVQDLRVLSTMNAVYSIAEGVKRTLEEKCGSGPGVCRNFTNSADTYEKIMANMDAMSFTDVVGDFFRFINREADRDYTIQQFLEDGSQVQVGSYNGSLSLVDERNLQLKFRSVKSACDSACLACQGSANNFDDFTYTQGAFNLVGLFDVHRKGATPFTCGDINTKHGFELLEAFNYAVDYVNKKQGIFEGKLTGIDIGAIGLDVCQSPTRAANLVANIHSGNINLKKDGETVNPKNFDVYIGTFETKASIRVADVLNSLSIPQISYGATSLELRDSRSHRYFLRTVPADDKQARAIISYLKRFNIDNVQVISTFDSVGEKGKEEFLRLAYLNRICVSQNITIGKNGTVFRSEASMTLEKIAKNTYAKVVILFVDDPRPILLAAEDDDKIRGKYFFIGTDKWGMDIDLLDGLGRLIQDKKAVTFDVETADLPGFDQYLESRMPSNSKDNPWFDEFFQEIHDCYLNNPTSEFSKPCTGTNRGIPRANGYIQDPYVLYVVNAVFSAALGIHYAVAEVCGADYGFPCNLFRNSGERRQRIYRNIREHARFEDATGQPFYFTSGGESDRGYHIYEPVRNPAGPGYVYKNVGSYNDTHYLKLDIRYEITERSVCQPKEVCQCVFPDYQPSRYMLRDNQNDLNLVYVADIHSNDPKNLFGCGAINTGFQFQNLMAFFYAIESVNNNTNRRFPTSLQFGGLALDTCDQQYRLGQDLYSLISGEGLCGTGQQGQVIPPSTIVAFIADGSSTALPVSSMLSPLNVTTISQSATTVELSNEQFHPYFLRTVPPDNIQAIVMLQIMKQFNWDYASVVYSTIPYGIAAKDTLLQQANAVGSLPVNACISALEGLNVGASLTDTERILDKLSQQVGSRVVILFTTPEHSRLLLQATRSKGLAGRFIWLASDYWANSQFIVNGYEAEASGAVTMQIRSEEVQAFKTFMKSLTLNNRHGIPNDWFEELYQTLHKCRLLSATMKKDYSSICTGQERITDDMIPSDPFILHTIISVYITAYGLNNLEECRSLPQLDISACLALQEDRRRQLIYNSILNSQLTVPAQELSGSSFSFRFTEGRYGDVGYDVLNYYRDAGVKRYSYNKIGSYQGVLTLDKSKYTGSGILDTSGVVPLSQCPAGNPCSCLNQDGVGTHIYARQASTSSTSYTSAIYILKEDGNYYNSLTDQLVEVSKVPTVVGRFTDIWAIIVATLAAIGCFIAACMFIYLLVVYPNRGGTSILGYTLCFGIILLYALVFAFIAHANPEICGLRRFGLGFVYALCYGSLFVKLLDCWRTQDKEEMDNVKYNKLGRPCGLFLVVVLLVLIQVIINAEWLILVPPETIRVLYNNQLWPRCAPDDFYDESLVLSLVYIMLLIALSVIFGFATFRKSKNHYESRWILGIAVLSIPCWVIWCLVASIGVYKVRDAAVAVGLLINATFMLLLGPLRKLYLLNKYQALIEEEEKEYMASHRPEYASYGRQYDNVGRFHEGSIHGSSHGSTYPRQKYAASLNGTQRSTGSAYNPYSDPNHREEREIQQ